MKFKMKDKNIEIVTFHQHRTYEGFLCGLPNEEINLNLINQAVNEANLRLFSHNQTNIKVTLLNPEIEFATHKFEASSLAPLGEETVHYPRLPQYVTTILLQDYFRQAVVVVFNHNMVDIGEIKEMIENLDWSQISEETNW